MSITFEVSKVARATAPLVMPDADGALLLHEKSVEALGAGAASFMPARQHGLLQAVHLAYASHYPLVLTPDMIWLAIAQGFAAHVNANADRLRERFVSHAGGLRLMLRRDDFVKGSATNAWPEVFAEFADTIAQHIGRQRDLVVGEFTTTGACERAAASLVLLDAVKQFFDYGLLTMCGIPEITLEGTVEDWRSVRTRAQALAEYELEWWLAGLLPVLDQFVAAAEGRVDVPFWRSLFKPEGGSGGPYVKGWINVLFPYLTSIRAGVSSRNDLICAWPDDLARWHGTTKQMSVPSGLACVPFEWSYLGDEYAMEFVAGFVGVGQDEGTLALRPTIGWAVRDAVTEEPPALPEYWSE